MGEDNRYRQAGESYRPPSRGLSAREIGELSRLWPFIAPYRWVVAATLLCLVVAAGTVLTLGVGLRRLVDEGFAAGNVALLDQSLIALFVVIAVLAASTYGRFFLVSWLGERVVADLRAAAFDRVIHLQPGFFEDVAAGDVLTRLTTDTTVLQSVVGGTASIALRNLLLLVGGLLLLAVTSLKLTGLVLLLVPLVVVPILVFGRRVRRLSRTTQDRVADLGAHVDESLNAIRTIQAFGAEDRNARRFTTRVEEAFHVAISRVRARAALTVIVILLVFSGIGVILWIGGHDVLAGRISGGELSAFVFYAIVVAGAVAALSEVMGELQRAAGAVERLLGVLALEPEIRAPANPKSLPDPVRGEVRLEKVRFSYPARPEISALDGLSCQVAPGETVALVGPSGAGKSTVFELLLRFYDPSDGAVRLDGLDLRDLDPTALRRSIGLVPQEPVLFAGTVAENIGFGAPDADRRAVAAAAEAAAASGFIADLPDGLDTDLGERAARLSVGQRQRLAIARALVRDPAVLLLDEATSALDAESEAAVQAALLRLKGKRTTLVIAHRLATVQMADRILVMESGRIVAEGRHDQLISQDGLYARLAELQFGDFAFPPEAAD
ncbi:MAG: ABC transporter transmembrane domain-containing protein [Alphaproteobacteria bacterium]|nr:ABC transporter transmembrane domain-containing protein [Alphaproteobacteria bacterium]